MSKVSIVIPTCRGYRIPRQTIPVNWIFVHDRQEWPIEGGGGDYTSIVAPDKALYGHKCSSIRSAGFLKAYRDGADFILSVDDDCTLPLDWAEQHVEALSSSYHPWSETVPGLHTRGMPYTFKPIKVAVSHGLWDGIQDLDGTSQKANPDLLMRHPGKWSRIHPPFAMSSMNFGFRREVAPIMYQPAQGEGFAFNRFDDIWLGVICQKILATQGWAFANGGAVVYHDRASNVDANIVNEANGKRANESFWRWVWDASLPSTLKGAYLQLADVIENYVVGSTIDPASKSEGENKYFEGLARNMREWTRLIDRTGL